MKIILARHGQTSWNIEGRFQGSSDVPLDETGQKQATHMAHAAAHFPLAHLYHSPLCRATETARAISTFLAIPMSPQDALKELNLGDLDGMTSPQASEQFPKIVCQWRRDPSLVTMPNGESLGQLQTRVSLALDYLLKEHVFSVDNQAIMVVSHNFAIISFLCYILNIPLSRFHQFQVDLGSFTIIESRDGHWRLISSNNTAHLSNNELL